MENTIFIQNLREDIDVSKLCDEFKRFGSIVSARIQCNDDLKSVGEAYITFEKSINALHSVKYMKGARIANKPVYVSHSVEKEQYKKIFIKNFSRDWDQCDLVKFFETTGTVKQATISEDLGKSNGYGFVVFTTHASAKKAVERFNGKIVDRQELIVERYRTKSERENLVQNSVEYAESVLKNSIQRNNLFIKNLPKDLKDGELQKLCKKYGDTLSVKIAVDEAGESKGFGFASFKRVEDAEKALKRLNGYIYEGNRLDVSFKQDGYARKHYMHLKRAENEIKISCYKQRSRSTSALQFVPNSVKHKTLMKI